MAEHLWFIPVSAGGSFGPVPSTWAPMVPPWEFNVQWNFQSYPGTPPETDVPCITAHPNVAFTRSTGIDYPSKLLWCNGRWSWRSCTDGQNITVGGQLEVGTVFARQLRTRFLDSPPPIPYSSFSTVEVWAKYRLDVPARLDAVILSINDAGGNISNSPNDVGQAVANTWREIYHLHNNWDGWDSPGSNLRVVLTCLGTSFPANVGPINVDVEWFAIRLTT